MLILLTGLIAFSGGLGALVWVQLERRERQLLEHREAGLQAAEAGDHRETLRRLGHWVAKHRDDNEALYHYAVASREVQQPEGRHIHQAINVFRTILRTEPDHHDARRHLMELYSATDHSTETIEQADRLLALDPSDAEALRHKTGAQIRLRQFREAMETAERLREVDPDDLRTHRTMIAIMRRLDWPNQQIIEYALGQQERLPDDPRFEFLVGYAHQIGGDRAAAAEWLRRAAERQPPDDAFLLMLVGQLDALNLFADAAGLLEAHASGSEDARVQRAYARRLWEANQYGRLLEHLGRVGRESDEAHSETLALKVIALVRADREDEARALAHALEGREGDNAATAWVLALEAVVLDGSADPRERIEACREALEADPANAYIRFFLGEAYRQVGETELALREWAGAAALAPSWAPPYLQMSRLLAGTNRPEQAVQAAQEALRRSLHDYLPAAVALAHAWAEALEAGVLPEHESERLAAILEEVHRAVPGEPQTLPLYIDLLARSGEREAARERLAGALSAEPAPPQQTLIRLAQVSDEHGFDLAERALALSEREHGLTPDLARAVATRRASAESPEAGADYLRGAIEAAGEGAAEWRLAWARYLEAVGDERAAEAWIALADENSDDLALQHRVLRTRSVRGRRAFINRVIERVREDSSEEGVAWRIARARWLLEDGAPENDPARAESLLGEVVAASPNLFEPRVLLAVAQERQGKYSAAIEQLAHASRLRRRDLALPLEEARLHLLRGRHEPARALVERVVSSGAVGPAERRRAAAILADIGQPDRAIDLLEPEASDGVRGDLLLAQLYQQRNQLERAEAIYDELMAERDRLSSPAVVQAYADFLAVTGRGSEAAEALTRLDEMELGPGQKSLILAQHARRHAGADRAAEHYRSAIEAMPGEAALWRALVGVYLEAGRAEDALAANGRARRTFPGDPVFGLIERQRELIEASAESRQLRPLLGALVSDASHRDAAVDTLRIVHEAQASGAPARDTMQRLRRIADSNPRLLPLQSLMIGLYISMQEHREALTLAARAMEAFPNEASPAEQATIALASQGRWQEVLRMADRWKRRSPARPAGADTALAEAHLNLGRPGEAMRRLEPYRAAALEDPANHADTVRLYARALVASGQTEEAAEWLGPLLPEASGWRTFWMSLSREAIEDPATAADWLERLAPIIPEEAGWETVALANHWLHLGRRSGESEHLETGMAMLREAANRPGADATVVFFHGVAADEAGDAETAEAEYRRAVEAQPDLAAARNNLAILIADRDGDLDEALRHAERALDAEPANPTFHDTLAHVRSKREEYDEAIANLNEAVRLDPDTLEWRVNLAMNHARKGDRDEARQMLEDIEASGRDGSLSPRGRDRLEELRTALADRQAAAP